MFREIIDCTEWSYIMRKSIFFSLSQLAADGQDRNDFLPAHLTSCTPKILNRILFAFKLNHQQLKSKELQAIQIGVNRRCYLMLMMLYKYRPYILLGPNL